MKPKKKMFDISIREDQTTVDLVIDSEDLAILLGFTSLDHLYSEFDTIREAIKCLLEEC